MQRNTVMTKPCSSSLLSCEKDLETILKKLFIESYPYCDMLKRLLIVNTKDCLENEDSELIKKLMNDVDINFLREKGYLLWEPKIRLPEHEEIKCYLIISFDNFTPNAENDYYRDCTVNFDIICHTDCWDIGNYRIRPIKIAGYIDGILNNSKLSGIGTFNFIGLNEVVLNEDFSGYSLMYRAVHGNDDKIPPE